MEPDEMTTGRQPLEMDPEMPGTVICGVDDSDGARDAARVAAHLAGRLDLRLLLVHVVETSADEGEALLTQIATELRLRKAVERRVERGRPSERLQAIATEENARLLVVGSRGRGSLMSALLGSVSSALAGNAPCAVLVVPPGSRREKTDVILCAVDDSNGAREALRVAVRLRDDLDSRLALLHAVSVPSAPGASVVPGAHAELAAFERMRGDELLSRLASEHALGTDVERHVVFGKEADAIADAAQEMDVDLVVTGARGRGPVASAFLGSVSSALGSRSPCPVLAVPEEVARVPTEPP